ncbi:hypothetical protein [Puniceibacterium confluentis]|uniref:hypothetical protein n=2 Tax=Puniceibacterium confluentis TaxID=1958944 RepID=UPI0011B62F32|nr:hypothetical protein [Puniceibacterium confluentis]
MFRGLLVVLTLGIGGAVALPAGDRPDANGLVSHSHRLVFLSHIPQARGIPHGTSLCVRTRTLRALGLPLWHRAAEYVLAERRCRTENFISLPRGLFATGQAEGIFPPALPTKPKLSLTSRAVGSWGAAVLLLAGLWAGRALPARARARRNNA